MTLLSLVEWLELGVFVALAGASLEQWRRRREEAAAWLAVTFALLGGILLADRFIPLSVKVVGAWFDRALIVDLALFPYCLYRFTSAFLGASRRTGLVAGRGTALVAAAALALPTVPGGHPGSWPWWYAVYATVFLTGWTALSLLTVARLWRGGRGQPTIARQRMRMLAIAAVVLNLTIFLLANASDHAWTGLLSGVLFLLGFAPPPALRARWRRPELEAFRRAEADLMRADTSERVTNLMLPHAARLVGAQAAVLLDGDGGVRACHGINDAEAATLARRLPAPDSPDERMVLPDVVAVRVRSGWMAVVTTASTPFFGPEELGLLRTLAHLAGLALDRAELFDRERIGRQALAEREFQLAEAQRTARLGSYTWDLRTKAITWSDEMHRVLGFAPGEVVNHAEAFASRLHPDDRDRVIDAWRAAPQASVATSIEYRIVLPDGDIRWIHGQARPVLDSAGAPVQLIGTLQDITERKLAEEAFVFQAGHDSLTQLPNRALFLDRL
ncbi:MAG TPA: PAS domain-containing protein, partial [Acidimicrobiia bacterium]